MRPSRSVFVVWHGPCITYLPVAVTGRIEVDQTRNREQGITSKRRSPWLCPAPSWGAGFFCHSATWIATKGVRSSTDTSECASLGRIAIPSLETLANRDPTGRGFPAFQSRYNRPMTITLSESARALLRRCVNGERVEITDDTRPAYRELVVAGLMIPLHTFTGGDESAYRLTEASVEFACARERAR